jgi:FlaA1/EpsC-like NDP-sugar epimerase
MIGTGLVIKPLVYYFFGLYRRLWVYASTQELRLIFTAVTTGSVLVSLVVVTLFTFGAFIGFPRSVLVIDWLLSIFMVGGLRFTVRLLSENRSSSVSAAGTRIKRALIVGAGDAGAMVVKELQKNTQLNRVPVGFLDDDPSKQKQQIAGVHIVGTIRDLPHVLDTKKVNEVIIAIPSAPGKVVRLVADTCRLKGIPFRTMPGIYELIGGRVNVSRLREVDITDLLRREPTKVMDEEKVGRTLMGKTILVTGAGGSIGKEICRQVARWEPGQLVMMGHGENSIFEAVLELHESFPALLIHPVIADMRDRSRMEAIFSKYHPDVVFHAAAHKHVPLMEMNIEEAVTNNVLGTKNIVEAAVSQNVERLLMISTDKAIRPANIMGATKRVAEMIVLDAAARYHRNFTVVRFGNVLGSRGSVVPLFKRQIARGGPITITHPDMKRYFMTIPEAVYLVLQAVSMGEGGEAFVLNMGQQVKILDLAEDLIRLSGLQPGKDIEVVFTGIRPGEKFSEDLWDEGLVFSPTKHPDIFRHDTQNGISEKELDHAVRDLIHLAQDGETEAVINQLDELTPGSTIRSLSLPEITSIE